MTNTLRFELRLLIYFGTKEFRWTLLFNIFYLKNKLNEIKKNTMLGINPFKKLL